MAGGKERQETCSTNDLDTLKQRRHWVWGMDEDVGFIGSHVMAVDDSRFVKCGDQLILKSNKVLEVVREPRRKLENELYRFLHPGFSPSG